MPAKIKLSSSTKHERSLKRLEEENLVKVSAPEGIEKDITGHIGRNGSPGVRGEDMKAIREAIGKLV